MAGGIVVVYHVAVFVVVFTFSLYHLVLSTISFLKPHHHSYLAKPYHPLPVSRVSHQSLPLHLLLLSLLLSLLVLPFLPSPSPLLSLQFLPPLLLLLLLLLLLSLQFLSTDLFFLLASLSFLLISSASSHLSASYPSTDLQSKASSISSSVSLAAAASSLALAFSPRLFLAEASLAASLAVAALWSLQSALSLYVQPFIPAGCHVLIGAASPTTRCDLEEARVRAAALFDLAVFCHAALVAAIAVSVYVAVAKSCGGAAAIASRRHNGGSYEALPTVSSAGAVAEMEHVQMKAIAKSSAQE